jgi:predicted 3-demethylubiquinone-9 3-methyltransferase (glyoxalase superfamily)
MRKINPFLWFDSEAEEASELYASAFEDSGVEQVSRYGDAGPGPKGKAMVVSFKLEGLAINALNGGPVFRFNPAISFFVKCGTEGEVDALWSRLSDSGKVLMELGKYPFSEKFGWIEDKYGLSWQLHLGEASRGIAPLLMFCGPARGRSEEAMRRYVSIFEGSRIDRVERYAAGEGGIEGEVKHARFFLGDGEFMAMDSGVEQPFTFTPAVSFVVNCETQEEVDDYWEKLSEGGSTGQCGWLEDKFGVSWQIVPTVLAELMSGGGERAERVTEAMLKMTKLDIAALKGAYEG